MPVKSYLAFSEEKTFWAMLRKMSAIECVEVVPSENRNVAVVMWETADEETDKACWQKVSAIEEVQCLALVFGHSGVAV